MELRRLALSGAKWTGAATMIATVLQLTQIAVLARLLRPEDFGLMALVVLVLGFAQTYADAGLSGAIVYRQNTTREELSTLFWLNVSVGIVIFVVLTLSAPLLASAFGQARLAGLIPLASLSFLVTPAGQQFYALLQKELGFEALAAVDVVASVVMAATAIVLAYRGHGVYSLVWGQLTGSVARSAALVGLGARGWKPLLRFRPAELRGYLRFGTFQMMEKTINFLSSNLDKLLIGSLIGTYGLGMYSVAFQVVMKPLQVVAPIVNRVALPLFAKVQQDDVRLRAGFLDSIRAVAMALFPVYAGMILLADPLVHALLGTAWHATAPVLRILAVLGFFYGLGNLIGPLLVAKGRVGMSFLLNVWRVTLYALAISIGSMHGVQGVAAGLVIATALGMFPIGFWVRWSLVRMRPAEYFAAFAPALTAALSMAACVLVARTVSSSLFGPLTELLLLTLLGALLYLLIIVPWQWAFILRIGRSLR